MAYTYLNGKEMEANQDCLQCYKITMEDFLNVTGSISFVVYHDFKAPENCANIKAKLTYFPMSAEDWYTIGEANFYIESDFYCIVYMGDIIIPNERFEQIKDELGFFYKGRGNELTSRFSLTFRGL